MSEKTGKTFDYSILYIIGNLMVFMVIYVLGLGIVIININNFMMKIIVGVILLPICALIEYKVLIRLINPVIELLLPESYKKEQEYKAQKFREANKKGKW
ncbi:MAG: hypothetical protein GX383_09660 [Clostridium sp.]|jgi:uncharacterized protein YqhQ|nr:hypothetical protein [Clostridium sp.]